MSWQFQKQASGNSIPKPNMVKKPSPIWKLLVTFHLYENQVIIILYTFKLEIEPTIWIISLQTCNPSQVITQMLTQVSILKTLNGDIQYTYVLNLQKQSRKTTFRFVWAQTSTIIKSKLKMTNVIRSRTRLTFLE